MMDGSPAATGIRTSGISHVVIDCADAARARAFYVDILGAAEAEALPGADGTALRLASGQHIVLCPSAAPRCFPGTGVHQAYRASPVALARIADALSEAGVEIARYHEDRPAEENDNFYFADPDGNRIQLMAGDGPVTGLAGIDHAAAQVSDIEWCDEFYCGTLGIRADHRVGWATADYVRARAWAEGKEDMAPGTRRRDQRYRDIPGGKPGQDRRVARPNMQLYLAMGRSVLGFYLALAHAQEPDPSLARGSPRTAFAVARAELDRVASMLAPTRATVEGPVTHEVGMLAASLYFRDPCGVFVELCAPRQGAEG